MYMYLVFNVNFTYIFLVADTTILESCLQQQRSEIITYLNDSFGSDVKKELLDNFINELLDKKEHLPSGVLEMAFQTQ